MNLYLVQHAEAKTTEEDAFRPLSDSGIEGLARTATFVSRHNPVEVGRILHSGKKRAQQTAEVLAEHIQPDQGVAETDGLKPGADPSDWADRLANIDEDIMLVGHLPHLAKLASLLVCGDESVSMIDFCNAGLVCLNRDRGGIWSIRWVVTPGLFK